MNFNMNTNFLYDQEYSRTSSKSEEEIKKLTLEEDLSDVKRSLVILTKGQQLQKGAIYGNLHRILKDPTALLILLPIIREELQNQNEDLQIEAARSLVKAVPLLVKDQAAHLLPVIMVFLTQYNQSVLDEWVMVFDAVVHAIPYETHKDKIMSMVTLLSQPDQTTMSQYISARMIGFLADILKDGIKGPLLELVRGFCSAQDEEIRGVVAAEVLLKVCTSISNGLMQDYLFANILELVYDNELSVRKSAIQLFFKVQHKFSEADRSKWVVKYFLEFLSSSNEEVQKAISCCLGDTYMNIKDLFTSDAQTHQLITALKEFADSKYEVVRLNCAYNFVGMVHLLAHDKYFDQLSNTFTDSILKDVNDGVRRTLTSSLHHLILHLGVLKQITQQQNQPIRSQRHLASTYKALMQDPDLTIQSILINNIHVALSGFAVDMPNVEEEVREATREHFQDFFNETIIMIERLYKQSKWDMLSTILKHLESLMDLFVDCDVFNKLMPVIQMTLQNSCWQARQYACYCIAKYVYIINDGQKRMELIQMMNFGCLQSDMYQMRVNYIDFVVAMSRLCSAKFFFLNKFIKVLDLAEDRVFDVRLKICRNLHAIRLKIDEEDDQGHLIFQSVIQRLLTQKKKVLTEQIKLVEEKTFKFNSGLNDEKKMHLKRDKELEQFEETRMAAELKSLEPVNQHTYDQDPVPLSPFLLNFIKKYKKRHSVVGTKVVATGAAANASLTMRISQNINTHKINIQKKEKEQQLQSLQASKKNDVPKPRRKSVVPQAQVFDYGAPKSDSLKVKTSQNVESAKKQTKVKQSLKPAYYSPDTANMPQQQTQKSSSLMKSSISKK